MVSRAGVAFQARRASGLFKTLFKNRMAAVGIVLLILFGFLAISANYLTPYNPYQPVSGPLAQPDWVTNFPDGYYFSKNIVVSNDQSFVSAAALSQWNYTTDNPNIQVSYAASTTYPGDPGGSIRITNLGTGNNNITVSRTFYYPYHGPPAKFQAFFAMLSPNVSDARPVDLSLYIHRGADAANFTVYRISNNAQQWIPSGSLSLDTQASFVKQYMGVTQSTLDPASIVFSSIDEYTYVARLTIHGQQTVYLDNLQLKLFGTAWGLLGTDIAGRDVWSQLIFGSRISLAVGLSAAGIGIGLGLLVGLMAGFLGKFVDEVLMRFTDMLLVIPGLPLLIVLVAVLGQHIVNLVIIIGLLGWMGFARIVRSQVLTLKERPFVEAAKASGAGPMRIIYRHIFPNIVSLTYVNLALAVPGAILTESALAFLGLSDPAVISWGNMFSNWQEAGALNFRPPTWWWVFPPGLAIAAVSLSFVLIGYALDELFNPKLRQRR